MRRLPLAALIITLTICLNPGCTKKAEVPAQVTPSGPTGQVEVSSAGAALNAPDLTPDEKGLSKAVVVLKTSKGTLKFKLLSKVAPNSTKRFAELAQSKFYNGLAFHRIVPAFVAFTGDPKSRDRNDPAIGTGGSGKKLKAEISGYHHMRGTVGLARETDDPDSADSQFYICFGPFPHLDDKYTAIGQIVDFGEKVSDKDVLDRLSLWDEIIDLHVE